MRLRTAALAASAVLALPLLAFAAALVFGGPTRPTPMTSITYLDALGTAAYIERRSCRGRTFEHWEARAERDASGSERFVDGAVG
jgi:hypothetical protein